MPSVTTIEDTAEQVWQGLDSPTIARAFILAYVIAQKVVQNSGANDFMQKGGLHADVRQDFIDTRCCTT